MKTSGSTLISFAKWYLRFKVSYEVMLDRLRTCGRPENVFARCILLARDEGKGRPKVTAWYMGMGLLSAFPPITRNALVMKWFLRISRRDSRTRRDSKMHRRPQGA